MTKPVITIMLEIGTIVGRAIAQKPELEKEWKEFIAAIEYAKDPNSPGGTRVTLSEIFGKIAPEALDMARVVSPFIDNLIELFDKDKDQ